MNQKNEKKLCFNCDAEVSLHSNQCTFCGANLEEVQEESASQSKQPAAPSFLNSSQIPNASYDAPYAKVFNRDFSISDEEWNKALDEEKEVEKSGSEQAPTTKKEMIALLLLLPGLVFCLFGLALLFFSENGLLTLSWKQNLAYFYFCGAAPLLFLGWRCFKP